MMGATSLWAMEEGFSTISWGLERRRRAQALDFRAPMYVDSRLSSRFPQISSKGNSEPP